MMLQGEGEWEGNYSATGGGVALLPQTSTPSRSSGLTPSHEVPGDQSMKPMPAFLIRSNSTCLPAMPGVNTPPRTLSEPERPLRISQTMDVITHERHVPIKIQIRELLFQARLRVNFI